MATSKYGSDAEISGTLLVTGSTIFNEDSHPTYDFRVESDGRPYALWVDSGNDRVGIGCFVEPNNTLEIHHEGGDADQGIMIIRYDGAVYANNILGGIGFDSADPLATRPSSPTGSGAYVIGYAAENHAADAKGGYLAFGTKATGVGVDADAAERMRITAAGNVGIGTTDPQEDLQCMNTARVLKNNDSQGAKAKFILAKSKGSEASPTVLANGHSVGVIEFNGYDGDEYLTAAEILCKIDAAPGDGDMAGAIYFTTTADGADDTTDRMVISSAGNVGIGTSTFDGTAAGHLTIANGTSPGAVTANQVYIGSKDSTGLSSNGATLEFFLEGAPEASAMSVPTMSHRISVWINGTEYYMYLDPA